MIDLIDHYESVAEASAAMLAAARRGDWDAMSAAEAVCAARVDTLRAASMQRVLADADHERKARIIRDVLRHDAEIRDLAMPWMARLQELIGESSREARVSRAYRTPPP